MGKIYLLYGDDEAAINETKLKLIKKLVPGDMREQNVSEFSPPGNRLTATLQKVMPPLIAELSTVSMFKDACRLGIVYNLENFYRARKSSKSKSTNTALEYFFNFLRGHFASSSNILIFICIEKPEKGKWVDSRSTLFTYLKETGTVKPFRSQLRQNFIDSILAKKTVKAVEDMRGWWSRTKSPGPIFNSLLYCIELLLQAKLVSDRQRYGLAENDLREKYLKRSMTVSIFSEFPSLRNKFIGGAGRYSMRELVTAMERLLDIGKYVFPQQSDKYVPDIRLIIEQFVLELTGGKLS
jgi:DNA polymerase III delta subunit